MAKGKKNRRDVGDDEAEVINDGGLVTNEEQPAKGKLSKKDRKKKKELELEEAEKEMEAINNGGEIPAEPEETKKKSKKAKKKLASESEESEEEPTPKATAGEKKGGFALLMEDSIDDSEEEVVVKKSAKNNKKANFQMLMEDDSDSAKEDGTDEDAVIEKKNIKKKDRKVEPDLDDFDVEDEGKKGKKRDKKKKKKKDEEEVDELEAALADLGLESVKDDDEKAQKKKEKKMRQKQQQNQRQEDGEEAKEQEDVNTEEAPADADGGKKKKKKKKGAATEEVPEDDKPKKGKKGLGKGTLAAMQEALKKAQEEEERLRKEEEERIKREEEAEKERLEKKRLEEERKALKKQREKERKEQLRKEGKLLTAKQKADKARAEAMLAAMRAKGMEVPEVGAERKPIRPGTRIRGKNKAKSQTPETDKEPTPVPSEEAEPSVNEISGKLEPPAASEGKVEKGEESEGVADAWDASSEDEEDGSEDKKHIEEKQKSKEEPKSKPTVEEKDNEDESEEEEEIEEEESSDESEDESSSEEEEQDRRANALARIAKRREQHEKNRDVKNLRAPVVCVLGHVDTGKTKILDKLRRTHVQDGEAGGITQQIGATNVPSEVIMEQCKMVKDFPELKLPGLLIIDTPGHESFSNLRDRGSSLCDIAILVVDIMHGLEPQTIESINLLKQKKTPFIIALNKIDRLYQWKSNRHKDIEEVVKSQAENTLLEFKKRAREAITGMAEQGLNAALFYENPDPKTYISVIPTSAHSGEGMGNLMGMLVKLSQNLLAKRLAFSEELQATVLEVKAIPGLGTTIDIVLVNGRLKEGQTMILAGTDGPIVTPIKALLTPSKMQDLRVKSTYMEHKEICAAQGVKIAAKELEKAIAGLNLLVANHPDEVEVCKEEIQRRLSSALSSFKLKDRGVFVQASTLGSLEALLEFLRTSKIPYSGVKIGPVVKKDVMKASVMLEHDEKYTVILAFDVKVERDAQEMADSMGVKIFQADIIYHLFDRFTGHLEDLKRQKREEFKNVAVFPCKLKMLPNCIFNSRDPIVAGVLVEAGIVKTGTPLCVPSKEFLEIGFVTSIQSNHKEVETARKGEEVCIKVEPIPGESPKMFGRHFDDKDTVVSKITRASIDACKDYFRDDLQKSDWQLMVELKKTFQIL